MSLLRISALSLLIVLSGCSALSVQQPVAVPTGSWAEYQLEMAAITDWELSGKIGIRTPDDSQSANLYWQQLDQQYAIEMTGPLGQGGARIVGQPGDVKISIAGEGDYQASSPEALMYDTLGWAVPVQQIQWWVRGLPSPDSPFQHQLSNNRLSQLQQDGWQVNYLRYSQHDRYTLPGKIRLSRDTLSITLIIKEWTALR